MNCSFLDNFALGTLLAPVTEEHFRAHHWEKKLLLVQRVNPNFYGNLFSLEDFDREVSSSPSYVKLAQAKANKNVRHDGGTTSGLESILADMQGGATLVLDALNEREPKLKRLCRLLAQQLNYRFQTNLYLTPAMGQGFTPHWDNHDVFILQIYGWKHWKVERERRVFPTSKDNMGEEGRSIAADADAFTLSQGDLVYIPRGFVHAAECGSTASLHITLGIHPTTWGDLLHAIINARINHDVELRKALPFGFLQATGDELVSAVTAVLGRTADEVYLRAAVDQFADELATRFSLDVSGQIAAFMNPPTLASEDIVGPRSGIVFRLHDQDETVRINYGGRTITFPSFLDRPLRFALSTPAYAIRDIEGDLEESEKLVFVERLLQEGLIVRKRTRTAS